MDDNVLRRLLSQLSPEDMDAIGPNALAQAMQPQQAMPQPRYDIAPMRMNTMRAENGPDAGRVTNLNFQPQQAQMQAPGAVAQGPAPMRTVGYGDGTVVDLGVDKSPPAPIDFSRGMADIPGVGKGYYTKDGRSAVVTNPDGTKTKVILGYDMAGSMALNKANQERAQGQAQIAHINEEIAASQQARTTKEGIPGMGTPQTVLEKQFGKAPDGQRWTEQGTLENVPGSGGAKLTEFQGKSLSFGQRAANSHEILNSIGEEGKVQPSLLKRAADAVPVVGGALGMAANKYQSPAQQQVEQAQRDFLNATLRQESGANINASEFANGVQQYFPQPNDSREVIAQKKRNRELVVSAFADEAGPARQKIEGAANRARTIFDAKKAIQNGADPAKVRARLQSVGINDSGV